MVRLKIAIEGGHGINTAGKRTPDDEREWSFNNKVVNAAIAKLKTYKGVEILRLDDPSGQRDVPLRERTNKANAWKADVLVSVHHNAMTGRWGAHGGVETFTMDHPQANKESARIANAVHPRIVQAMGLRNRGVKKMNLHMLRESNMPAILTEGGFMDSTTDIHVLRDNGKLRAQGVAIAEGLAAHYGLKSDGVVEQASKPVAAVKPTPKTVYEPGRPLPTKLAIDGRLGPITVRALQRYFHTPIDGIISNPSALIIAMQKWLGTQQDGVISKPYSSMVAALQKRYGTTVDGRLSNPSAVIMKLQQALNAGRL